MVTGLLQPDAGSISVFGIDALADPIAAKRIMAWVSDEPMIYDKLTPFEYLEFVAGLWGIDAAVAEARAARAASTGSASRPTPMSAASGFSKGMRQKVALAGALVHEPKLIILDEPLTGLDAGSARAGQGRCCASASSAGGTVIMTTHILEVAERMADRIGVIAGGRLIAEGTLDELRRQTGKSGSSLEDTFLALVAPGDRRRVSHAGTLAWFARHECRLAWRDWLSHDDGRPSPAHAHGGDRPRRLRDLHARRRLRHGRPLCAMSPPIPTSRRWSSSPAALLLSWSLMLSQAMESVTRAFYARADLDLILSSPAAARRLFAVRIAAMAVSTVADGRAAGRALHQRPGRARRPALARRLRRRRRDGRDRDRAGRRPHHRALPPDRPQAHAARRADRRGRDRRRLRHRPAGRRDPLLRHAVPHRLPGVGQRWWRSRPPPTASSGGRPAPSSATSPALAVVLAAACSCSAAPSCFFAPRFAHHAIAAAGISNGAGGQRRGPARFRRVSPAAALRRKEWTLLRRDPWLLSQTLMQMLYLLPPALLLWRNFSGGAGTLVLLSPVLIMAAGQLAGGLAWLAISGEDAPDLVATAPVSARHVLRAKIEAVMGGIALVFAPFVAALAFAAPFTALVSAVGILAADGLGHRHPALVPHPGQAQPVPPPPDLVARRHLRRGAVLDRLGRDGRRRGCWHLARGDPGITDARHPPRRPPDQSGAQPRIAQPPAQRSRRTVGGGSTWRFRPAPSPASKAPEPMTMNRTASADQLPVQPWRTPTSSGPVAARQ